MTAIQAARLGHPTREEVGEIEPREFGILWEARERVDLDVSGDEPLARVIRRAAVLLDLEPLVINGQVMDYRFVAFDGGVEEVSLRRRITDRLTVVDENGAATWGVYDFETIPYSQIVRSTAAGTIPGNPHKLFVVRALPWAGGGIPTDWQLILLVLLSIERALAILANVHGAAQLIHALRARVRRGRAAIAANEPKWMLRNGTPDEVRGMLRDRAAWPSRDVAALLGCTVAEAEDALRVLGYGPNASGAWVWAAGDPGMGIPASDDLARLLVTVAAEVEWDHSDYIDGPPINRAEVERTVRRILRDYVETGRLPPTREEQARAKQGDEPV